MSKLKHTENNSENMYQTLSSGTYDAIIPVGYSRVSLKA